MPHKRISRVLREVLDMEHSQYQYMLQQQRHEIHNRHQIIWSYLHLNNVEYNTFLPAPL